ncbi:MAG TPA: LytTR family DNA-binding domain-containing protein [Phenylobacterium sp.]
MTRTEAQSAPARGGPPPDRAGDLLFIAITLGVLVVVLTFNSLNVLDERARGGHPVRFWEPPVWEGSSGVYFLAVSPLMLALARRFWMLDPPRAAKLAAHAGAALLFALGHVLAAGAMRWAVYAALGGHYNPLAPLGDWAYEFRKDVLVYAGLVAIYTAWRRLRAPPQPAGSEGDVLEVRDGARRHFVPLSEVLWIEAAGNYVELHRGATGLLHRASLSQMEQRLESAGFVRIHRSRLVRREAIAAVESKPTGDFLVRLRDGRELAGSRRFRRPLLAD